MALAGAVNATRLCAFGVPAVTERGPVVTRSSGSCGRLCDSDSAPKADNDLKGLVACLTYG